MATRAAAIELTALEHLYELLRRILWSVGFAFGGGVLAYIFRLQIINFLQRPLHENLYYTSPMGSFQFVMQVCLLCGLICALPILLYNLLRFIEPAFDRRFGRRTVVTVLFVSLFLAAAGLAFAYYATLPAALRFFNSVGTKDLHPLITANEYFSFLLGYLTTFAFVFQLPLILLFIDHIRPFGPGVLGSKRRFVYVGAFAISLVMPSSPDPLSQVSLAIPIITLYEVSILLIYLSHRKKARKAAKVQRKTLQLQPEIIEPEPMFDFAAAEPIMAVQGDQPVSQAVAIALPIPAAAVHKPHKPARPAVSMPRPDYLKTMQLQPARPNPSRRRSGPIRDVL